MGTSLWDGAVAFCRFLGLDRDGYVVRLHEQDCGTDGDIRDTGAHLFATSDQIIDIEVWTGPKLVMRVDRQATRRGDGEAPARSIPMPSRKLNFSAFGLACSLAALFACSAADAQRPTNGSFQTQLDEFQNTLKQCTDLTGYDPQTQSSLGPYELGQNELRWRDCAYTALTMLVVPNTKFPDLYADLIDRDKEMTRWIEEKRFTRNQREAQISALRQKIITREENSAQFDSERLETEERMRIDMISNSMQSLARDVQRRAR